MCRNLANRLNIDDITSKCTRVFAPSERLWRRVSLIVIIYFREMAQPLLVVGRKLLSMGHLVQHSAALRLVLSLQFEISPFTNFLERILLLQRSLSFSSPAKKGCSIFEFSSFAQRSLSFRQREGSPPSNRRTDIILQFSDGLGAR